MKPRFPGWISLHWERVTTNHIKDYNTKNVTISELECKWMHHLLPNMWIQSPTQNLCVWVHFDLELDVHPQVGSWCAGFLAQPWVGPGIGLLVKHRFSLLCRPHTEPCRGLTYTKECLDGSVTQPHTLLVCLFDSTTSNLTSNLGQGGSCRPLRPDGGRGDGQTRGAREQYNYSGVWKVTVRIT